MYSLKKKKKCHQLLSKCVLELRGASVHVMEAKNSLSLYFIKRHLQITNCILKVPWLQTHIFILVYFDANLTRKKKIKNNKVTEKIRRNGETNLFQCFWKLITSNRLICCKLLYRIFYFDWSTLPLFVGVVAAWATVSFSVCTVNCWEKEKKKSRSQKAQDSLSCGQVSKNEKWTEKYGEKVASLCKCSKFIIVKLKHVCIARAFQRFYWPQYLRPIVVTWTQYPLLYHYYTVNLISVAWRMKINSNKDIHITKLNEKWKFTPTAKKIPDTMRWKIFVSFSFERLFYLLGLLLFLSLLKVSFLFLAND